MKFNWRHVLVVFGLFLLVVLVMDFNRRMEELDSLSSQLAVVRSKWTAVMQTQEALINQVAYAASTEAVEEWAYVDGKWVRPGEHLIAPMPEANVTPTPLLPPTPQVAELPNWRIWWELFFGNPH